MMSQLTQRESPVVWGNTTPRLLNYEKTGYHQQTNFFKTDDIQSARIEAMVMRDNYEGDGIIYERDEKTVRSLFGVYDSNHRLEDLLVTENLIELAMEALDSDVYIHQIHINYKQAYMGGGYFWHSDYTYWHWEDGMPHPRCVSMIIPLEEMRYENGPLFVHSGSHMFYGHSEFYRDQHFHPDDEIKHDEADAGGATKDQLDMLSDDESKYKNEMHVALVNPGDLFMMDANLLHMSVPNWSPFDRMCAFVCLNSVENQLGDPRCGRLPRPQYISNRNVIPLGWMTDEEQ